MESVNGTLTSSESNAPHGPGIGFVPAGTRFEIFHRIRKMERRANPIPKDTPKYWRMPIVTILRNCSYVVEHCVPKRGTKSG
jgi:hypothetical protein